jgi:Fic family protein
MSRSTRDLDAAVLDVVRAQAGAVAAGAIQMHLGEPRATVNRALSRLVAQGLLKRSGAGRAVVYEDVFGGQTGAFVLQAREPMPAPVVTGPGFPWSRDALALVGALRSPLGARPPVSYKRDFVEGYVPNTSGLLPGGLATQLLEAGRSKEQQPAGTYARRVLEQLLIDLSWSSSRLEGNRKSLLDTRALFERGRSPGDDRDATMLLNHKEAIEFMVDAVPTEGVTVPVVRNLQAVLMRDLLPDTADLGAIRSRIVNIQGSVYLPSQVPTLLEEMLAAVIDKARRVHDAVEAAFFLWVNVAYLQPFADGNKRTSRLAANMPLMLSNCAPLSFLDVEPNDYALAMLGVYERCDVSLAVELFEWTYRRSILKYQAVVESMGGPDPVRSRYREQLGEAIRQIVYYGIPMGTAVDALGVVPADRAAFDAILETELQHLQPYNCARYRLPFSKTQVWIDSGRPRG